MTSRLYGVFKGRLFSGNIAISDENPNIENTRKAAQKACIHDYIESFTLKDKANNRKYRKELDYAITRAIYKNSKFIFLDEATLFLDISKELAIMNNLPHFFNGKTVLIIAHQLSTVKNADNIIVLEHERIAEQGNHNQLIQKKESARIRKVILVMNTYANKFHLLPLFELHSF